MATAPKKYRPARLHKPVQPDRPTSSTRQYGRRWRKARAAWLRLHPLCVRCQQAGRDTEATVVDHRTPHRGDGALFWDESNWDALCAACHNAKSARELGAYRRASY
jgi:5-methylcytosine-specific restriction protein A